MVHSLSQEIRNELIFGGSTVAFDDTFIMLTEAERAALLQHATRKKYASGSMIITQGHLNKTIFVVASGTVNVVNMVPVKKMTVPKKITDKQERLEALRSATEKAVEGLIGITIAKLGSGSIFGDMSFIEDEVTSASVIADGTVEILRIDEDLIDQLIEADPSFAGRFYHSLAITVSRRLRKANKPKRKK